MPERRTILVADDDPASRDALCGMLSTLGFWVTITQGAIFVLCVLAFRRGIIGELARLIRKPL